MGVRLQLDLGDQPSPHKVETVLRALARLSYEQMQAHPLPPLYASGVRYARERGREDWQTAHETFSKKRGDCEDLAAWRCAELWVLGEKDADVHCYAPRPGLIHCVVRRADGRLEDPSKRLGMKGKG
jgi:hypothetical protein